MDIAAIRVARRGIRVHPADDHAVGDERRRSLHVDVAAPYGNLAAGNEAVADGSPFDVDVAASAGRSSVADDATVDDAVQHHDIAAGARVLVQRRTVAHDTVDKRSAQHVDRAAVVDLVRRVSDKSDVRGKRPRLHLERPKVVIRKVACLDHNRVA